MKSSSNLADKVRFDSFKKLFRSALSDAKKSANDNFILNSKNKCKAAWYVIKNESGKK